MSSDTLMHVSLSPSRSVNFEKSYGPPLRPRLRLRLRFRVLSFYEGTLLSSFKKIIESELLIMEVQQLLGYFQHRTFAFGSIQWVWDKRCKWEAT